MTIIYSKRFKKQFKKLRSGGKKKFEERVNIFIENTSVSLLNDHALHGKLSHYRSFSITGDIRVLYKQVEKNVVMFIDIDTHSNFYA